MPTFRRHRRGIAVLVGVLVVPLGAGACATWPPASPRPAVALGPCGLVVADAYGDPNMQPPYELHMIFRPSGDEARLTLTGTGWGRTRYNMTGPGKTLDGTLEPDTIDGRSMINPGDWIMPAVGTWHFRFTDDRCFREFDVEVKPKV